MCVCVCVCVCVCECVCVCVCACVRVCEGVHCSLGSVGMTRSLDLYFPDSTGYSCVSVFCIKILRVCVCVCVCVKCVCV